MIQTRILLLNTVMLGLISALARSNLASAKAHLQKPAGEAPSPAEPMTIVESSRASSHAVPPKKQTFKSRIRPIANVAVATTKPPEEPKMPAELLSPQVQVSHVTGPEEAYQYAGQTKRDPFVPPLGAVAQQQVESKVGSEEIPIVSPLQFHKLKDLVVTGVWQGEQGQLKAMIETPDQQGIIAKLNDPVGNGGGHIVEISSEGVKVRQYLLAKDGSRVFEDAMIGMAREVSAPDERKGKIILNPGAKAPELQIEGSGNSDMAVPETQNQKAEPSSPPKGVSP